MTIHAPSMRAALRFAVALFAILVSVAAGDALVDQAIRDHVQIVLRVPSASIHVHEPVFLDIRVLFRPGMKIVYGSLPTIWNWGNYLNLDGPGGKKRCRSWLDGTLSNAQHPQWGPSTDPSEKMLPAPRELEYRYYRLIADEFPAPGTYTLQVSYRGLVQSNAVNLTVKPATSADDVAIQQLGMFGRAATQALTPDAGYLAWGRYRDWLGQEEQRLKRPLKGHGARSVYRHVFVVMDALAAADEEVKDDLAIGPSGPALGEAAVRLEQLVGTLSTTHPHLAEICLGHALYYAVMLNTRCNEGKLDKRFQPTIQEMHRRTLAELERRYPEGYYMFLYKGDWHPRHTVGPPSYAHKMSWRVSEGR